MVDVAKEVGADAVSHGCTGKGNDQASLSVWLKTLILVNNFILTHFYINF